MNESKSHTRLSPSKRHRWSKCPGSVREENKYPDVRSSAAKDGTHTHTLLEKCIKGHKIFGWDSEIWLNKELEDEDGKFIVDIDRCERVNVALSYISDRVSKNNFDIFSEIRTSPCQSTFKRDDLSGTIDVLLVSKDTIEIIDYKDGMGIVSVKGNLQLEQYGIGLISSFSEEIRSHIKNVRFTIIQPKRKFSGHSDSVISSIEIPFSEFYNSESVNRLIIESAFCDNPDAPLIPGKEQCAFCKHKANCKPLSDFSFNALEVPVYDPKAIEVIANLDPKEMDNSRLTKILEISPLVKQLIIAVEEETISRIKRGISVPGFKLVNGRGSRSWKEESKIAERLVKMGIPKSSVYVNSVVSPAQVEKIRWVKKDGTSKKLTPRQIELINREYVEKSSGSLLLVPESDSRQSIISTNVENLFPSLENPNSLPSWMNNERKQ